MRPWYSREDGVALVVVLALLTLLLVMLGSVVSLAPTLLRRATFETELMLALYAAESGLNHGLAAADAALRANDQSLGEWLDTHGGKVELSGGAPHVDGEYSVEIVPHPTMAGATIARATGTYQDRTRSVEVVVRGRGALFPKAIVAVDPGDVYHDPSYIPVWLNVPTWRYGAVSACFIDRTSGKAVIQDEPACVIDEEFAGGEAIEVRNSIVYVTGNLLLSHTFVFEDSTVYVNGDVTIKGTGELLGTNRFNIGGSLTISAPARFAGEGGTLGAAAPWNHFYVRDGITTSGKVVIGSVDPEIMPDVLFLTEATTTVNAEDEVNGAMTCACGFYSPSRNITFNGNAFDVYGAAVGDTFTFSSQHGPDNIEYDAYEARMLGVDLPGKSKVVPSGWTEG